MHYICNGFLALFFAIVLFINLLIFLDKLLTFALFVVCRVLASTVSAFGAFFSTFLFVFFLRGAFDDTVMLGSSFSDLLKIIHFFF